MIYIRRRIIIIVLNYPINLYYHSLIIFTDIKKTVQYTHATTTIMKYNFLQKLLGIDKSSERTEEIYNKINFLEKTFTNNSNQKIDELINKVEIVETNLKNLVLPERNEIEQFIKEDYAFNLTDPLDNTNLFSFEILDSNTSLIKKSTGSKAETFLRNIGSSMPEIVSNGLLANSYKFVFPQGVSGTIMKLGNGQGTAIIGKAGKIMKHGKYVSNLGMSAPLMAVNIGSMIIRQHYLAKINESLDEIKTIVSKLLQLEFIKKHAQIESIISFLSRAQADFELIENRDYKNSILSNIIRFNNEIIELILFYGKSLKLKEYTNTQDMKLSLQYYLTLHSMYIQGKLLEFKYAGEYNDGLLENLKKSFSTLSLESIDILKSNQMDMFHDIRRTEDSKQFFDIFTTTKDVKIENLTNTKELFIEAMNKQRNDLIVVNKSISDFQTQLKKPQSFLIANGELYEVQEVPKLGIITPIIQAGMQIQHNKNAK